MTTKSIVSIPPISVSLQAASLDGAVIMCDPWVTSRDACYFQHMRLLLQQHLKRWRTVEGSIAEEGGIKRGRDEREVGRKRGRKGGREEGREGGRERRSAEMERWRSS